MTSSTDRIEKRVLLRAPRARVWRAISDSTEFGSWFGVRFDGRGLPPAGSTPEGECGSIDGAFVAGARINGVMTPTSADPEIAKSQRSYEGMKFGFTIDRIEPMNLLSFRWHPFAIDPKADYSAEPMTLVVFELADDPNGTHLTITESGFDGIPLARRAKAFAANDGGWTAQSALLEKYIAHGR